MIGKRRIMEYRKILYEKDGGIAKIILNRPDKLNAMDGDMIQEIGRALENAEQDHSIRVVVLTGKGRAFCAGMDVQFCKRKSQDAMGPARTVQTYKQDCYGCN